MKRHRLGAGRASWPELQQVGPLWEAGVPCCGEAQGGAGAAGMGDN